MSKVQNAAQARGRTSRLTLRTSARRAAAVAAALASAAAPLTALGAGSVYTGGGAGTPSVPVSGNFSTGFTPTVTAGAASLELDFSNSGTNAYTATNDIAGTLQLNAI